MAIFFEKHEHKDGTAYFSPIGKRAFLLLIVSTILFIVSFIVVKPVTVIVMVLFYLTLPLLVIYIDKLPQKIFTKARGPGHIKMLIASLKGSETFHKADLQQSKLSRRVLAIFLVVTYICIFLTIILGRPVL